MSFPLYSTLKVNLSRKNLTIVQKNDFIRKVTTLDSEVHDLLYALIKCYFLEEDGGNSLSIPYKGKLKKDRIDFDLNDLPAELGQLLYKFINIHQQKLIEDEKIRVERI